MSPRERVLRALNHEQTDVVPYNVWWDEGVRQTFVDWTGDPDFDRDLVDHFLWVSADLKQTHLPENEYVDEWGCRFKQGNIFHLVEPRLPEPRIVDDLFPDLSEEWRYRTMSDSIGQCPDKFILAWFCFGFFERGWMLRGMENWLMDLVEHESFVNELLDGVLATIMAFVDVVGKRSDVDAILLGDDYGQQHGSIMGPALWRKFFKPRVTQVFKRTRARQIRGHSLLRR